MLINDIPCQLIISDITPIMPSTCTCSGLLRMRFVSRRTGRIQPAQHNAESEELYVRATLRSMSIGYQQ